MNTRKLSEICHINPKKDSNISDMTEVSFIPMSSVSEGGGIDVNQVKEFKEVRKGFTCFLDGDVLFAKITPCMENGKGTIAKNLKNGIGFGSTEFHVLRPRNKEIKSEWVYYLLHSKQFRNIAARNMTGTAGQKRVPSSYLENFRIPVPSLQEQKQIVKTLDTADTLRQKRKEQLNLLDDYLKSVFFEMFGEPLKNEKGWDVLPAEKCIDVLSGYAFKSDQYTNDQTQTKLCGGLIIYPDRIDWNKANYWPNEEVAGLDKYYLKVDDIVMALDRPWISSGFKMIMLKESDLPSLLVQRTARIRVRSANKYYFYHLLKHKSFALHCRITETTVPHISTTDIKTYMTMLPPIELQNKFASIVEQVEQTKQKMRASLDEMHDHFHALMQRYFG